MKPWERAILVGTAIGVFWIMLLQMIQLRLIHELITSLHFSIPVLP